MRPRVYTRRTTFAEAQPGQVTAYWILVHVTEAVTRRGTLCD